MYTRQQQNTANTHTRHAKTYGRTLEASMRKKNTKPLENKNKQPCGKNGTGTRSGEGDE